MRVTHRFEPARRPSTIGLFKPNTRGSAKPPIHRWEHSTPLRYKLRAVYIPSKGFLLIEGIQCSADLHTGTDSAADRAASGGNRQSVHPASASMVSRCQGTYESTELGSIPQRF